MDGFWVGFAIGMGFALIVNVSWGLYCLKQNRDWARTCERQAQKWQQKFAELAMQMYRRYVLEGRG